MNFCFGFKNTERKLIRIGNQEADIRGRQHNALKGMRQQVNKWIIMLSNALIFFIRAKIICRFIRLVSLKISWRGYQL